MKFREIFYITACAAIALIMFINAMAKYVECGAGKIAIPIVGVGYYCVTGERAR